MGTEQPRRRGAEIQFRVLIVGRANAGKTSILQRVCDTTESPIVYRGDDEDTLEPSDERSLHTIDDELIFSKHDGYVFHDSRGIESGSTEEVDILQGFIERKCGETRLQDRLHAIWYCIPMDNHRPDLEVRSFELVRRYQDQNVPVIAVFTKYDQFLINMGMEMHDFPDKYRDSDGRIDKDKVPEDIFQEHYLRPLGDGIRFVRLKRTHKPKSNCDELIEMTAIALNEDVAALMLLAVPRGNLELSVKSALNRINSRGGSEVNPIVEDCVISFPYLWWFEFSREFYDDSALKENYVPERSKEFNFRDHLISRVVSLPTIQNLIKDGRTSHELILAVILILKHATSLRPSKQLSPQSALDHAELDYREANIDLIIQEYLTASQEHSVKPLSAFIMAIDIGEPQSLVPAYPLGDVDEPAPKNEVTEIVPMDADIGEPQSLVPTYLPGDANEPAPKNEVTEVVPIDTNIVAPKNEAKEVLPRKDSRFKRILGTVFSCCIRDTTQ